MSQDHKVLPSFDELPHFKEYSGCAWDVWGPNDQLGTVNLLTDDLVKQAVQEEIRYISYVSRGGYEFHNIRRTGRAVSLNW